MPAPLFMEVVFNYSAVKTTTGKTRRQHTSLDPRELLEIAMAPGGFALTSFALLPPMQAIEFAQESDGVFLRPFFKWIASQTTAQFRPIRRADFVHISTPGSKASVATWMVLDRKRDMEDLRRLFTVVVENVGDGGEEIGKDLAWGRLDPRIPNKIPGRLLKL